MFPFAFWVFWKLRVKPLWHENEKSMHGLILILFLIRTSISFPIYTLYNVLCTIVYIFMCLYTKHMQSILIEQILWLYQLYEMLGQTPKAAWDIHSLVPKWFPFVLTYIYTHFIYMKIYTYSKLVLYLFSIYTYIHRMILFCSPPSPQKIPLHFLK